MTIRSRTLTSLDGTRVDYTTPHYHVQMDCYKIACTLPCSSYYKLVIRVPFKTHTFSLQMLPIVVAHLNIKRKLKSIYCIVQYLVQTTHNYRPQLTSLCSWCHEYVYGTPWWTQMLIKMWLMLQVTFVGDTSTVYSYSWSFTSKTTITYFL